MHFFISDRLLILLKCKAIFGNLNILTKVSIGLCFVSAASKIIVLLSQTLALKFNIYTSKGE